MQKISRILVIRFSSLGDIVLLSGFFRELKKVFPQAKIDFLTATEFAAIYRACPHISKINAWPRSRSFKVLWRQVSSLNISDYDLVFDAHCSMRSRLIRIKHWLAPAKWVKIKKRTLLRELLVKFKINLFKKIIPQRRIYLNMLSAVSYATDLSDKSELFIKPAQVKNALVKLNWQPELRYFAVAPGASSPLKRWPLENFGAVCTELSQKNYKCVIIGAKGDIAAAKLAELLIGKSIDLVGQLDLLETGALLQKCDYAITNDSAATHLAEAVGTPVITIFGATTKEFGFAPQLKMSSVIEMPLKCRPCSKNGRGNCHNKSYLQCLTQIKPAMVIATAESLMKN